MSSPASSPLVDRPVDRELSLQVFLRELQSITGDLTHGDLFELGLRLTAAIRALPPGSDPAMWSRVRGLATDAFVRLCREAGWHCCELTLRCDVGVSASPDALSDLLLRTLQVSRDRARNDGAGRLDSRVERAIAYIRGNCTRHSLGVEDVARHVGLSRWHLSRLLVRSLGVPYREVVRSARMEEAERLLSDDALSVKEVAARLGYPHATELDRAFKQHSGSTPTEWRLRRRSGADEK